MTGNYQARLWKFGTNVTDLNPGDNVDIYPLIYVRDV
jgi:hypothetical protein